MIARLTGTLLARALDEVVVDCQGVGYALSLSTGGLAALPPEGSAVSLHVYTHVAEDALKLFGFVSAAERGTFAALVGTNGVGPKLALAILGTLSPAQLGQAVATKDKRALTRIPGVGGKKAERLLLDLEGRLASLPGPQSLAGQDSDQAATDAAGPFGQARSDLQSALVNLGFAHQVAEEAADQALQSLPAGADLPALLRQALRLTTRRPERDLTPRPTARN